MESLICLTNVLVQYLLSWESCNGGGSNVWYSLDWICDIIPVNIPQDDRIILIVSDYRNGYYRLQPCCSIVKFVVMTNRYKMVSCPSCDLSIDIISDDANLLKVLFCLVCTLGTVL